MQQIPALRITSAPTGARNRSGEILRVSCVGLAAKVDCCEYCGGGEAWGVVVCSAGWGKTASVPTGGASVLPETGGHLGLVLRPYEDPLAAGIDPG